MTTPTVKALLAEASALSDEGRKDEALAAYFRVLELDFNNAAAHYDIGLIHKYRGEWKESFKYNKRAAELQPDDEGSHWNLAIAATALRDWKTARRVWQGRGLPIEPGEGPIEADFGSTPVRLNPDGHAEVVWGTRVCPVRARIDSIPLPESGIACGDVVLHDGAPVGHRLDENGREKSVFNMLEMFEPGSLSTYVLEVVVEDAATVDRLRSLCEASELPVEDWQANIQMLCKACSEGRPHEQHDHESTATAWTRKRRIAIAAPGDDDVAAVLEEWDGEIEAWGVELER